MLGSVRVFFLALKQGKMGAGIPKIMYIRVLALSGPKRHCFGCLVFFINLEDIPKRCPFVMSLKKKKHIGKTMSFWTKKNYVYIDIDIAK